MKNSILLKIFFLLLIVTILINCKNENSKPTILKITPEKYLSIKKKLTKEQILVL